MKDNKFNGFNRVYIPAADLKEKYNFYEGQCLDGKLQGYGRMIWYDGPYYEGDWDNDQMDG
ncbi:MAG: hypothetical protein ACK55Z_18870 [bacterium]